MIYLDSSALLKLLFQEAESDALEAWLATTASPVVVTSEISKIEVIRAARRLDTGVVPAARALVRQLDLIPLSVPLIDEAAEAELPMLRTLDAIHLASAQSIRAELSAFVSYDLRLNEAAEMSGLPLVRPGAARPS